MDSITNCIRDGCNRSVHARQLCNAHYEAARRAGFLENLNYRPTKGPLSAHQAHLLDGELLGDGCLRRIRPTANAWALWSLKSRQHIDLVADSLLRYGPHVRSMGTTGRWCLKTRRDPTFTKQYERWYPSGLKVPPTDLVLSPTVCLHWFLGDGSNRGAGALRLHTEGFIPTDTERLATMLVTQGFDCGLRYRSYPTGRKPYIYLLSDSGRAFLDYIGPCPISDYAHRWQTKRSEADRRKVREYNQAHRDEKLRKRRAYYRTRRAQGYVR